MIASLFIIVALAATAMAQTKPNPPEDFFAKVGAYFHRRGRHDIGQGVFAVDQSNNKAIEDMRFDNNPENHFFLQRFDLGKIYEFTNSTCNEQDVSGNMPKVWGFLNDAKFAGQHIFKKRKYELWRADYGGGRQVDLAVYKNDENKPALLYRRDRGDELIYEFFSFKADSGSVNATIFDVPSAC